MRITSNMSLRFDRTKLMELLSANRAKHATEYEIAVTKHREKLIEKLTTMLATAQTAGIVLTHKHQYVELPIPESHLEEYDRVLKMLGLTTQNEITLSQGEFSQLVDDEWEWANSFAANTKSYGNA